MEKTKLDLNNLWNEITDIRMDAEKINLLSLNVSVSNKDSVMFLDILFDYNQKIIESLEKIEDVLKEEVKING